MPALPTFDPDARIEPVLERLGVPGLARRAALRVLEVYDVATLRQLRASSTAWTRLEDAAPVAAERLRPFLGRVVEPASLDGLRPGMTLDALQRWADDHGVRDLLALPASAVPALHGRPWTLYQGGHTRIESVVTTPVTRGARVTVDGPSTEVILETIAWLVAASRQPPPPPLPEPRRSALQNLDNRLRAEAEAMLAATGPSLAEPKLRVELDVEDPVLRIVPAGADGCRSGLGAMYRLNAEAPADSPVMTCICRDAPPACRARLHALRFVVTQLADPTWAPARMLEERLGTSSWQRTLAMLTAGPKAPDEARLGWMVDLRRGTTLKPVMVTLGRGGAERVSPIPKEELGAWRAHEHNLPADNHLLAMAPALASRHLPTEVAALALHLLAGHPRVVDHDRARLEIRSARLDTRLDREDGQVQVHFSVEGFEVPFPTLLNLILDGDGATQIQLRLTDRVYCTDVSADTRQLIKVLAKRGRRFPMEALPPLLDRLVAQRIPTVLAPELGVARAPAFARAFLRLELGDTILLRVAVRVRPHPQLGTFRPGEGPTVLIAQGPSGVVQLERSPAHERTDADALRESLALDPDPTWTWSVMTPDRAMEIVAAAQADTGLLVEWTGRRPVLREAGPSQVTVKVNRGTDWFAVGGELTVEGATLPLGELLGAMREARGWVRVEGDVWVRVEASLRDRLAALADAVDAEGRIHAVHAPVLDHLADAGAAIEAPPAWLGAMDRVREAGAMSPTLPVGLTAELRPYQHAGFAWMTRLLYWSGGAVLADDMGLGKTVQALAVLVDRATRGPQLVVAPMSVGFNWVREVARFAPGLRVHLHHGADRPDALDHLGPADLVVTTYDILVRDPALTTPAWATVVFDEAQALKNAETQRVRAARALRADARIALTGTPIENRLAELWSLFSVVLPGLLGSAVQFRGRFEYPVERDGNRARAEALGRIVRPFVLRRLKSEVARELPARTEVRVDVELRPDERSRYDTLRVATLSALSDDESPPEQVRFKLLAALTRLRQLTNAARLVDDTAPPRSAKVDRLLELLAELRAEGRRALVFSQFAELLRLVRPLLEAEGARICMLTGSTTAAARRTEVDRFQRGEADVFLISLKAGGTGLNLTAASEVVLIDPWWNPAVEDQAADRAHRIGQTQAVTIYRLVARDTLEDTILQLHDRKRDVADAVLAGTGSAGALPVEELLSLLQSATRP